MTKLVDIEVNSELKQSFIDYAMAVNRSRSIPDVRDGLKPVHRRILYSMNEMGLTPDKPHKKCATIVGDVLGKYHPHGDSSVYDALVRLAQDFSINHPLVDGHGNFGSVDGDPAAAYRYTEARMSKLSLEMLADIDKNTVDCKSNFDDTRKEPVVLPSRYPNLLVNGADGIAVGMATNIPPHNLGEVIDGTIALIENPEISIDELMEFIPAPDFPTGGILMGRSGIRNAYRTGRGGYVLRSKCEIEEYNNGTRNRIIVTEIPYQVNKQKLIETIAEYVKDKRLEGISNINDESDRHGMRIVIDIKKDANPQVVLNSLYKQTKLQTSDGIILLALVGTDPKVLNIKEILIEYLKHQRDVIARRTKYDLDKAEERCLIVTGLIKALSNIDRVVEIIKTSNDRQEAAQKLIQEFDLDAEGKQANAILDMRLQTLTHLAVSKLEAEYNELMELIKDYKNILATPSRIDTIIKEDLIIIKNKYANERKSEISVLEGDIEDAALIPREDVVISMTNLGYVKRLPVAEYKAQNRGGKGITGHKPKEEDFVKNMFISSTHDDIMFFTSFGKVFRIKGYEIPEAQRTARGRAVVNLLQLSDCEKVNAIIPVKEGTEGYIAMATRNGLIKKTALSEFENIRKTGKIAISLNEGDELVSVQFTSGEDEILIGTKKGKCIRFYEGLDEEKGTYGLKPIGRDTQGVKAMDLDDDDVLIGMTVVNHEESVLTITSNGYGKLGSIDDYRLQGRAGKGIKAGTFNEKTGSLVCLTFVSEDQDVMLITDNGIIIRVRARDISKLKRDTQGVIVMRLKEGEVSTVAVVPHEEIEEGETIENEEIENSEAEIIYNSVEEAKLEN
ncbi:MAG: DNA gyrase subunit A [Clostridia bacterium]|nr:DNA gyrase subunit A [Clostridia bacterium]